MPQLNPAPWFMTLISVWLIMLMLFTPKLMKMYPPTQPNSTKPTSQPNPWHWMWH